MKMEKQLKHISKLMSLVLRHQPEAIGLKLDENGWINVKELIQKMNENGTCADIETINAVVNTNDKKRFSFNEDKSMIRANQGHSIEVELNLKTAVPPDTLLPRYSNQIFGKYFKRRFDKTTAPACTFELAIRNCHSCWRKAWQTCNFKYQCQSNAPGWICILFIR